MATEHGCTSILINPCFAALAISREDTRLVRKPNTELRHFAKTIRFERIAS